jgi:hypothetical protein
MTTLLFDIRGQDFNRQLNELTDKCIALHMDLTMLEESIRQAQLRVRMENTRMVPIQKSIDSAEALLADLIQEHDRKSIDYSKLLVILDKYKQINELCKATK